MVFASKCSAEFLKRDRSRKRDGFFLFALFCLSSLLRASAIPSSSFRSRAPSGNSNSTLVFCPCNQTFCCNAEEDRRLRERFQDMNVSDYQGCASLLKSILCANCGPLFVAFSEIEPQHRIVPPLCNSSSASFCSKVWDECQNIPIQHSPFAPSLPPSAEYLNKSSSTSRLSDFWKSSNGFCTAFGGLSTNESACFDGHPVQNNDTGTIRSQGLCLERLAKGSYIDMAAHPDGSIRIFLCDLPGRIWLASVPEEGSGRALELNLSNPFLDITSQVHYDTQFGLMSVAFHPNFSANGRFFASFNCDAQSSARCSGRCSCNSDVGCDPSKIPTDNGAYPCRYQSVIAEFTANGTSATPSSARNARATEVERILTIGLPFTGHHAAHILFGPEDGYLYIALGDGGGKGDPYNFAQNKKSLLGKILRVDVDNMPSQKQKIRFGLWGNYSIPRDNPYFSDKELLPEIWAMGFRNPWRCSFDSDRPSYLFCADSGQETYEEVDLVTKGGNYGWRAYEGPYRFTPQQRSPGGNTSLMSMNPIFPVLGYPHSSVSSEDGSASIAGGYMYRASADPCMSGRYLFGDLYGEAMWVGTESPKDSGNFTNTKIPFSCAGDSSIPCDSHSPADTSNSPVGYMFSLGQDNNKDVFLLTSTGVYRVTHPSRCNYSCSKETVSAGRRRRPSSSSAVRLDEVRKQCLLLVLGFLLQTLPG